MDTVDKAINAALFQNESSSAEEGLPLMAPPVCGAALLRLLNPFCRHVRSALMQRQADRPARAVGFKGDLRIDDFVEEFPLAFREYLRFRLPGGLREKLI